ncbi:uncharacterized protein [Ptychodera flava]|uniref:uncharacterized protein n=1 Tax=Ptychodera flava TaxID=63121 RepID=UPI003969C748
MYSQLKMAEENGLLARLFLTFFLIAIIEDKGFVDGESNVRLVHGHNKYEGRVEVYRSVPGWTPVCLWKWDLLDADITCRELGRPGAMSMGGDFGALFGDERQRIINLECTGKELSILGCSFDSFPDCYNTGTAKCNYDGYLGCHATQHNGPVPHHYNIHNDAMTIQACLDYCRSIKAPYAGLTRAAHCYCGNHEVSYWGTENTPEKCKTTCGGDRNQICGGNRHVSVYSTDLGACGGNITKPTTIYSPGFPGNISDDNANCSWSIRLPTGSAVKLEFIISEPSDTNDLLRIVEIFEGRQRVLESRNTTVRSCSNEVDVDMFSYGNTDTEGMFAIEVTAVYPDCQLPADLDSSLHLDMFYLCPLFAGDNVSVSCHRGYSLATPHYSVVCQEDGTWNDTFPQCKITECDDPGAVNNAFRVGDSLKYLSTITYTCHQGFVGGGAISCVDSGLWTEKPSCNPINCGDPGYIQHAGRTGDDFTYNRSVVYSCRNDYGYFNHGNMAIVCQSDGTWTEKPSCIKIDTIRELAAVEPNVLDTGITAGICVGALMLLTIITAVAIIKRRRKLNEKKSSMDILLKDHPFNDVIEGKKTQNNGGWIIIDDTAPDKCTKPAKHFYEKCASTSTEMTSEYGERDYEEMDEDVDYDCIDTVSSGSETTESTNTRCHGDHPTLPAHERFRTEGSQLGTAAKDDAVMVENILYQSADVDEVEDDEYAEIDDADTSQTCPDENEHDSLPSAQMADNSEVIYYVLEGP